jgi:hypothetical protein
MRRSTIRLLGVGTAVLIALLALSQVVIPGLVEGDAEERLTERGGSADVEISAFPALGLLIGGRGGSIEVRGADIPVDLLDEDDPLERLDGFADVDVRIENLSAGPLEAGTFTLTRNGRDSTFRMHVDGRMTPEGAARYAGEQVAGPLGGLIGDLTGVMPFADEPLPVRIDAMLVKADDGGVRITSGGGSVAGIPLGPFSELLVEAVAARL